MTRRNGFLLFCSLCLVSMIQAAASAQFALDHFKVYDIRDEPTQIPVLLKGQFDSDPVPAVLTSMTHFANPVSKQAKPILDKNAHLAWYALQQETREPKRSFDVENQFGQRQRLTIGRAVYLLTPAEKKEVGIQLSDKLSHFKCYEVLVGDAVNKEVSLQDQFGKEERVIVRKPKFFCVPVEKKHGDKTFRITNEEDHLTVYEFAPADRVAVDQFSKRQLKFVACKWLSVPSKKHIDPLADHCKVYDVEDINVDIKVSLKGQFDEVHQPARLTALTHFANPVQKNDEPLHDKNAHSTWYQLKTAPAREHTVEVTNQFGTAKWRIGGAVHLVTPAEKKELNSRFPKGMDHFKSYKVIEGQPVNRVVRLSDQFGVDLAMIVGRPLFLCVPVEKVHGDVVHEIKNPEHHLAVYEVAPAPRAMQDQFASRKLIFESCEWLCVPSEKRVLPPPRGLDHFKIYKVEPQDGTATVLLQGQFDDELKDLALGQFTHFATPVSKNDEPILDEHAHLKWYTVDSSDPDPKRTVEVNNQFGEQTLVLGQPKFLAAPAEKIEDGSGFPEQLDHFKCYEVLEGEPIQQTVSLEDQFGRQDEARVGLPKYFCVPVDKEHNGEFQERKGEEHLTIYEITPETKPNERAAKDQFGTHEALIEQSVFLGVPTEKLTFNADE